MACRRAACGVQACRRAGVQETVTDLRTDSPRNRVELFAAVEVEASGWFACCQKQDREVSSEQEVYVVL